MKNWLHQYPITFWEEFLSSTQDRYIAKFNICSSNFEDKILPKGTFVEKIWSNVEEGVDTIISNKQLIRKTWYTAVEYDYIPEGNEMLLIVLVSN